LARGVNVMGKKGVKGTGGVQQKEGVLKGPHPETTLKRLRGLLCTGGGDLGVRWGNKKVDSGEEDHGSAPGGGKPTWSRREARAGNERELKFSFEEGQGGKRHTTIRLGGGEFETSTATTPQARKKRIPAGQGGRHRIDIIVWLGFSKTMDRGGRDRRRVFRELGGGNSACKKFGDKARNRETAVKYEETSMLREGGLERDERREGGKPRM